MSDIKLFRVTSNGAIELTTSPVAVEKSLQTLVEQRLETLLGVRYLASEYSTGKTHSGRIDTLGIDENRCPVIIEYKRSLNQNVINQGLFYLDWLLDHKAEFTLLVMRLLGEQAAEAVEWSSPRLLCIAGDFTRYDKHAVQQINRNIELIRYCRYGDDLLLFELVNATTAQEISADDASDQTKDSQKPSAATPTFDKLYARASVELLDIYEALKAFLIALGDDVQVKHLKHYVAFKRFRNFACVEIHPWKNRLSVYVKVNPTTVELRENFTRDVSNVGHLGTGDLEITIDSHDNLALAENYLVRSYEVS